MGLSAAEFGERLTAISAAGRQTQGLGLFMYAVKVVLHHSISWISS